MKNCKKLSTDHLKQNAPSLVLTELTIQDLINYYHLIYYLFTVERAISALYLATYLW